MKIKKLTTHLLTATAMIGAYVVLNILGADDAFAQQQTIGNVINSTQESLQSGAKLVYTGSYIGGVTALMMGAFKLKQHAENPGQTPMQQGLARLAVGAGLCALPSVGQTVLNTAGTTGGGLNSEIGNLNIGN